MKTRQVLALVLAGVSFYHLGVCQQIAASPSEVSVTCKVKDGAVTRSFKIITRGKVSISISSPVDYVRVSPTEFSWGDGKDHSTEVKVVFFPSQQLVNPKPWRGAIMVKDQLSRKQVAVIYQMKCSY